MQCTVVHKDLCVSLLEKVKSGQVFERSEGVSQGIIWKNIVAERTTRAKKKGGKICVGMIKKQEEE